MNQSQYHGAQRHNGQPEQAHGWADQTVMVNARQQRRIESDTASTRQRRKYFVCTPVATTQVLRSRMQRKTAE